MRSLCLVVLFVGGLLSANQSACGQTVRFETSVGDFDMVLNPTNNPNLQPLVDNVIAYVGLGRYHHTAINRAADNDNTDPSDDFVLQMGSFLGFPPTPDLWAPLLQSVERFDAVVVDSDGDGQVDFDTLSNTRGTISLALAAGDVNSGTSSFFVNLGDNQFLDGQGFVPFAEIEDMTTIDSIMELMQADLSAQAGQPGSLAFVDVPLSDDGRIVVVERVSVVEADDDFSFVGPIATALQLASRDEEPAALAASSSLSQSSIIEPDGFVPAALTMTAGSSTVPEPTSVAIGAALTLLLAVAARRR